MAGKVCPDCEDYGLLLIDGTLVQCPCQTSIQWAEETLPMSDELKLTLLHGRFKEDA